MVTRAVYRAREQFLADGEIRHDLAGVVSPAVLRSWRRSRLSGARPEVNGLPLITDEPPATPLTSAAEPVLARLAEQFAGLRAGVLLSDRHAKVLRRWAPDLASLQRMDDTRSAAGASGAESVVGTNGIGTVAEERKPRMVVGPEHFADVFTNHVCIGAPIHHPLSRRFEGVVTLSADIQVASPLLLPLVMGIAREVEQRLLEQSSRKERMLLDAFLSASRRGGAVAVIGQDVFMVSPRAARLLRGVDPSALWLRLSEEITVGSRRTASTVQVGTTTASVLCEPLLLDAHLVGAVVEVDGEVSAARPAGPLGQPLRSLPPPAWTASELPGLPAAPSAAWREVVDGPAPRSTGGSRCSSWASPAPANSSCCAPCTVLREAATTSSRSSTWLARRAALRSRRALPVETDRARSFFAASTPWRKPAPQLCSPSSNSGSTEATYG